MVLLLIMSFLIFSRNVMHLVLLFTTLVFFSLLYLVKMNALSMIFLVLMALIYLGGMSVIVSYVCCVLPSFSFKLPKKIFFFLIPSMLFFESNLNMMELPLPISYLFFFEKASFWLLFVCVMLLLGLIGSNYVDYPKGSLRSL